MPLYADWTLVRGEDGLVPISLTPPVDVTGWDILFAAYRRYGGGTPIFSKQAGSGFTNGESGITFTNAPAGLFSVNVLGSDTSGLDQGAYNYVCNRITSGFSTSLIQGYLLLT